MNLGIMTLNNGDDVLIQSEKDLFDVIEKYLSYDIAVACNVNSINKDKFKKTLDDLYDLADDISDKAESLKNQIDSLEI